MRDESVLFPVKMVFEQLVISDTKRMYFIWGRFVVRLKYLSCLVITVLNKPSTEMYISPWASFSLPTKLPPKDKLLQIDRFTFFFSCEISWSKRFYPPLFLTVKFTLSLMSQFLVYCMSSAVSADSLFSCLCVFFYCSFATVARWQIWPKAC